MTRAPGLGPFHCILTEVPVWHPHLLILPFRVGAHSPHPLAHFPCSFFSFLRGIVSFTLCVIFLIHSFIHSLHLLAIDTLSCNRGFIIEMHHVLSQELGMCLGMVSRGRVCCGPAGLHSGSSGKGKCPLIQASQRNHLSGGSCSSGLPAGHLGWPATLLIHHLHSQKKVSPEEEATPPVANSQVVGF